MWIWMTQSFGTSVCKSGLHSSRGPCLWPWNFFPLLSTMTRCVMHAFAMVLTDLSCGDLNKGIMFISNVRRLRHRMLGLGTLSYTWKRCCQVICCCWKAKMAENVASIPKTVPLSSTIEGTIHLKLLVVLEGLPCFVCGEKKWAATMLLWD